MLAHMRKQSTEKLEARFMGTPENILRLRQAAKRYNVIDVTTEQPNKVVKDGNKTVEEVFPELQYNRTGVVLRGYRSREEFTQKQLSEMTGIPQRHISELEHGKRQAGKEWAKKLAAALHCDYRMFL